jgi:hypothetical protein
VPSVHAFDAIADRMCACSISPRLFPRRLPSSTPRVLGYYGKTRVVEARPHLSTSAKAPLGPPDSKRAANQMQQFWQDIPVWAVDQWPKA